MLPDNKEYLINLTGQRFVLRLFFFSPTRSGLCSLGGTKTFHREGGVIKTRWKTTELEGVISGVLQINKGVPPGSVLGPLLCFFFVCFFYINCDRTSQMLLFISLLWYGHLSPVAVPVSITSFPSQCSRNPHRPEGRITSLCGCEWSGSQSKQTCLCVLNMSV